MSPMQQIAKLRRLARRLLPSRHRHAVNYRIDVTLGYVQTPHLPAKNETAAVAPANARTAALVYDRVWDGTMGRNVPDTIAFRGRTDFETGMLVASAVGSYVVRDVPYDPKLQPLLSLLREMTVGFTPDVDLTEDDVFLAATRAVAENISTHHRMHATPVFADVAKRDKEYRAGDYAVTVAVLDSILTPDEASLTWEQVREVRQDHESRERLIRLHHWLDAEMIGKSWQYIEDEISVRVSDYEHTLKKHGIKTILGSLAQTLDSKLLVAGSLSALAGASAGQPVLGALGAVGIVVGKVAVNVASSLLDLNHARRVTNPEVAFVIEAKKLMSRGTA